jgi:hypothetical protein
MPTGEMIEIEMTLREMPAGKMIEVEMTLH